MRPEERDDLRALLTEAYQPYANDMPPEVYEPFLAGILDTERGRQFVAVDGDTVLGGARLYPPGLTRMPIPSDWAWVRAVGVRTSARRTGVARRIMAYCAENAGDVPALSLHTMDFMPDAIRLYERLGYERAPDYDFVPPHGAFTALAYRLLLR